MVNPLTELGLRSESPQKNGGVKMKIRGLVLIMVAVELSFAPQFVNTSSAAGGYSSRLISPTLGQVLYHGQQFRIEWVQTFPQCPWTGFEMEFYLSLDAERRSQHGL